MLKVLISLLIIVGTYLLWGPIGWLYTIIIAIGLLALTAIFMPASEL